MKKIITVVKYETWVEDDVSIEEVEELITSEIESKDALAIEINGELVWLNQSDVMTGTSAMISVGTD